MNEARQETSINNLKLVYYQFGNGEPLLFLHGRWLRALSFKRSLKRLAARYTVIAPDIPGYGLSDTPKDAWSYSDYANFFSTFLDELNLQNVTVVGYSMGGGIAFNLAADSARVKRLLLVDAAGSGMPRRRKQPLFRNLQHLVFYIMRPQYYRTLLALAGDALSFSWKHRNDQAQMQVIRQACARGNYETTLRRISIPTLILWGNKDSAVPVAAAYRFQTSIPQSQLKIIQGTHDWPLYDPLLFSQSML